MIAKRFIISAGGAIAIFSGWGFMESFADAPHAPGWLVYSLFWLIFGIVSLVEIKSLFARRPQN